MLVPATADDLRFGGKIIYEGDQNKKCQVKEILNNISIF